MTIFRHLILRLGNRIAIKKNGGKIFMNSNDCLEKQPLCDEMLTKMDAWWRAANYLAAGQLYLLDNPLTLT